MSNTDGEQQVGEPSLPSLTRERFKSDESTEIERSLVDRALERLAHDSPEDARPGTARLKVRISESLARQRAIHDAARSVERSETDTALRDATRSKRAVLRRLCDELKRSRTDSDPLAPEGSVAEVGGDVDPNVYAHILAELDAIFTAASATRDHGGEHLDQLCVTIELSASRILELVGELLDREAHRLPPA